MRLQRLEINGFKSFSDRSELAFDQGVTAIVGPNGCGKSNVADAITWVMGEQSAKSLRGDKMEDVIFSGSDARKPTAAAEVRLRFAGVLRNITGPAFPDDHQAPAQNGHTNGHGPANGNGHHENGNGHANGEPNGNGHGNGNGYHAADIAPVLERPLNREAAETLIQSVAREIEVTRRLYRSGESEYLIDGQVCRLRDVHDLLMDTGLGAKAYAIIEQGKIGLILSSRPTDRRQLIEEAAGVTKYKARRRSAELKLDAAQLNLTRVDDIVFEVEKQRGTLKRQAAKARRYQKLRDELRRWEKVLFARKYRQLAESIESVRARLGDARGPGVGGRGARRRSRSASEPRPDRARRSRITGGDDGAKTAHACELAINRQQQQIAFDRDQVQSLAARSTTVAAELDQMEARREPARAALDNRRQAVADATAERDRAAQTLAAESESYDLAHREIEGLEADVEAARSEVFSAINSATALRHAIEHASAARERVLETLSKLDVERGDVRIQSDRAETDRAAAAEGLRRAQEAIESARLARLARESELASARIEHEWRARSVRNREQELAGLDARLKSLEELEAARAAYGDAARTVLAQANGKVNQQGAIADYLDVESGYERAVEACLGDLLQHIVVDRPEHAAAGFDVVREAGAGRCGFLITSAAAGATVAPEPPDGYGALVALSSVVSVNGPHAAAIRSALGNAWIADAYSTAADASRTTVMPVVTLAGDVFRGPHLVAGGGTDEGLGILQTKREIKQLRERIQAERESLRLLSNETADLEGTIAHATNAIAALNAEHHKQEKVVVGYDAQVRHASDEALRLVQKGDQLARERRQAEEERETLDRRQQEALSSITQLEDAQRVADERLTVAQRRLFEAREAAEELSQRAAAARADHAGLVERASALTADVARLEEAFAELELRAANLSAELNQTRMRVDELRAAIAAGDLQLQQDVLALDALRFEVSAADDAVSTLRISADQHEAAIKGARGALEATRAIVSELDIARVTAEADLSHLAHTCVDAVNATLDEVLREVEQLEAEGQDTPDPTAVLADEVSDPSEDDREEVRLNPELTMEGAGDQSAANVQATLTADEAITRLRAKIERLGPVNMMAIDQFDELEKRHAFLTTQRNDLVESIRQTTEAIKRIDETTRHRFSEAFAAINANFQQMFSTLFGGGRAGLTLLDENDPLESGIEIIAQPPGKRLQSVQLLSGGEKALTAIALMFGMFKYKPSPFCLLDEIDAPLDDANIGRFVEMLRSMQAHTQFIVITHNRKTMEIADRLYGVTMEEPGVSKLISVQLN